MTGAATLLALLLGTMGTVAEADATTVRGGTVEVGKGAAGTRLGMKRSEVIDKLGRPNSQNPRSLSYGPEQGNTAFDVYLEGTRGRPVRMLGFWGRRFVLPDGTKLFRRGAVRKLKARYGERLKRLYQRRIDVRTYRLKSRYRGRRVWTDFNVDRFGNDARIVTTFILFPYWTP